MKEIRTIIKIIKLLLLKIVTTVFTENKTKQKNK